MTTTRYEIEVIHEARDARMKTTCRSRRTRGRLRGSTSICRVVVVTVPPTSAAKRCTVVLGGAATAASPGTATVFRRSPSCGADRDSRWSTTSAALPLPLLRLVHQLNGWTWSGPFGGGHRLARLLGLEDLGIEVRNEGVISHKRDDGLLMAEQVDGGSCSQRVSAIRRSLRYPPRRASAGCHRRGLGGYAFLLLLESPLAHTSPWVFDEVESTRSATTSASTSSRGPALNPSQQRQDCAARIW